ncbi:MAG TPA: sigma 54-interacting transcriptional regulator [Myxococcaceae bacterium]|nr:sigma 54-interacting transcriptional regulator [Myxococcaceae bacterium]
MSAPSTQPIERPPLLRTEPGTGALRSFRYRVTVSGGPDAGAQRTLQGPLFVGTHADAGLRLTDPTVSRYHVELRPHPDGVLVRDLGSTNGTFLHGTRVTEVVVQNAGRFLVGHTELSISQDEEDLGRPISTRDAFGRALGRSRAMRELFGVLEAVAPTDSTVVLLGESGTGKELLAEALHLASPRRDKPLVVFDCGAVAPTLVESELFGHVKGSYTGATQDRLGAFLSANGGTLFLDEIGELPPDLQPKLLRALERGTVKRLGEDLQREADVRIVAATHRDLEAETRAGRFRADLYYRLAVVVARVPPLRERPDDLPLLVDRLLQESGRTDFQVSPALMEKLAAHSWPGNVRELRNLVQRALAGGGVDLQPRASGMAGNLNELPFKEAKEKLLEAFTKEYLQALLARCEGNMSEAARSAGLTRSHLYELVERHGLKAAPGS